MVFNQYLTLIKHSTTSKGSDQTARQHTYYHAQADRSLCWSQISHCWKSHVAAPMCSVILCCCLYETKQDLINEQVRQKYVQYRGRGDFGALKPVKPSCKIFLLTVPRRYFFTDHLHFLCFVCFSCFCVCSLLPCGHLLGKSWPLGSCL